MIRNLLDNAARNAASRVAIAVRSGPGTSVTIHVDDHGSAIAARDRDRVFDRFVRLEEGRARDMGGTGLGLAVVRGLVQAHGGTVVISDAPEGGTRFSVVLPKRPPRLSY